MNKEFKQWVDNCRKLNNLLTIDDIYLHIQANPHLLREDGEKEPFYISSQDSTDNTRFNNKPRPTDMETEAREMGSMAYHIAEQTIKGWFCFPQEQISDTITALTEFGKMWYERGREREEELIKAGLSATNKVAELRQQLAEKDEDLKIAHEVAGRRLDTMVELQSELDAAKAEIGRLKKENEIMSSQLDDYRRLSDGLQK